MRVGQARLTPAQTLTPEARLATAAVEKIVVRDVGLRRASADGEVAILEGVSLTISEGEFVCLVGPSGCGKTTLLHVLAGLNKPTSGRVLVDAATVEGPDPRRVICFQQSGVFPWLTVAGNVAFPLRRLDRDRRQARVAECLALVGLSGCERLYPRALSGGMLQRLEMARALAVDPEILYLDEPFAALDFITRMMLRGELARLWSGQRKTIVLVTHDIDEAVQLADRVMVMSGPPGRVRRTVAVDLPRPRDLSDAAYLRLRDDLLREIGLAHQV